MAMLTKEFRQRNSSHSPYSKVVYLKDLHFHTVTFGQNRLSCPSSGVVKIVRSLS